MLFECHCTYNFKRCLGDSDNFVQQNGIYRRIRPDRQEHGKDGCLEFFEGVGLNRCSTVFNTFILLTV